MPDTQAGPRVLRSCVRVRPPASPTEVTVVEGFVFFLDFQKVFRAAVASESESGLVTGTVHWPALGLCAQLDSLASFKGFLHAAAAEAELESIADSEACSPQRFQSSPRRGELQLNAVVRLKFISRS